MNIKLNLGGMKRAASGHPWIRRADLNRFIPPPPPGTLIRIQDAMGNFLGHGVSDGPGGEVVYRVLSRERHPEFNPTWFASKVEAALGARDFYRSPSLESSGRLIHGEADGLPGVFCDAVGRVLLLHFDSPGMETFSPMIEDALWEFAKPETLWRHTGGRFTFLKGSRKSPQLSAGREGLRFWVRLQEPRPWDFDPAESAHWARLDSLEALRGQEALVLFSRCGSWGAAALKSGASMALCVDRDFAAQARAKESLSLNPGFLGKAEFEEGDAFRVLERLASGKRRFGLIVADLPSHTTGPHGRFSASKDYPKLASRLLPLLKVGGKALFCFPEAGSGAERVKEVLLKAATDAGLTAQAASFSVDPQDYPLQAAFPEGRRGLRMDVTRL